MMIGEWLVYTFASVVVWGFVNVLDSYFVGSKIYKNIYDGMIISSLYKGGALLVGFYFLLEIREINLADAILSMLGGALLSVAYMFYFAAMLYHNDMSLIQVAWNFSSPIVVLLGGIFLGEEFSLRSYIGMGTVFLGALIVSFTKDAFKRKLTKFALLLLPMIILYSVSEVLMKYIEEGRNVGFGQSFPFFCLGQFLFGTILLFIRRRSVKRIGRIIRRNWVTFFSSEALELFGLFLMQIGISKTPSVALFGVVESFMPVMVIILTGVSVFFLKILKRGETLKKIYEENILIQIPTKIIATAIMMVGVYLI